MSPEQKSEEEIALDASLQRAKQNSKANCPKRLNIAELNARLAQEMSRPHPDTMEDEEEEASRKRAEEFKRKRNQHYN